MRRPRDGPAATPQLSARQSEIGAYVARGVPDKVIAERTGLSIFTVRAHVQAAAARLPGNTSPRHKLTLFFFSIDAR